MRIVHFNTELIPWDKSDTLGMMTSRFSNLRSNGQRMQPVSSFPHCELNRRTTEESTDGVLTGSILKTSEVLTKTMSITLLLKSKCALVNSIFQITKDIWIMSVSYWKNAFKLYSDRYRTEPTNHIGSRWWRHEFYFFNNSRRNEIQMFVLAVQIILLSSLNLVFKWICLMQRQRSMTPLVHQCLLQ